jgi:hypothetical protein
MKKILTTCFILVRLCCMSQTSVDTYNHFKKKADSLYRKEQYGEAAQTYSRAFRSKVKAYRADRYTAACCWASVSKPDSAFVQLRILAPQWSLSAIEELSAAKELASLHGDPRWSLLLDSARSNIRRAEAGINRVLLQEVDSLKNEDQRWRTASTELENKGAIDSVKLKKIWSKVAIADSLNYISVKRIWEQFCYPNSDLLGKEGSHNFWLLMQHQDKHPDFQEEVLSGMKLEVERGKSFPSDYAYLTDRVKVNRHQLQIYGSQMTLNADHTSYAPKPLVEPEAVNERRMNMGLPSIEEYIEIMNTHYKGTLANHGLPGSK